VELARLRLEAAKASGRFVLNQSQLGTGESGYKKKGKFQ